MSFKQYYFSKFDSYVRLTASEILRNLNNILTYTFTKGYVVFPKMANNSKII